jgi:Bacterial Ig domain/FecR protein
VFEPGLPVTESTPPPDAPPAPEAEAWDFDAVDWRRLDGAALIPAAAEGDPAAPEAAGGEGERLVVAQAAVAADLPAAAGRVERVAGSASVVRNGVQVELHLGDPIYRGDVVQTGSGGTLTVKFLDGTVLGLSAGARVVVDKMLYASGSSGNSALFNLVQGAIGLIAGRAARSGEFEVETPVATMGVRGTAVRIEVLSGAATKFSLLREPNGAVGAVQLFEKAGQRLIGTMTDARIALIVTALTSGEASATPAPKSAEELRADGAFVRDLFRYSSEQQRRGSSDGESDLILPAFALDLAPLSIDLAAFSAPPEPENNLAPLEIELVEVPESVTVAGSATEDGPFVRLNPPGDGDDVEVIVPSRLPAGVTFERGTGRLQLDPSDPAYQHLAAGETLTVTVQYQIAFGSTVVPATASWKVVGRNDAPTARNDWVAAAGETGRTVLDLRGNDVDIDRDGLTFLSWTTPLEGTVRRNADGDLVFDPGKAFAALSANQTATVQFTYTISDGHGGISTAVATVTVKGEGTFTAPPTVDTQPVVLPGNRQTALVSLEAPSRTTTEDADVSLSVRFGTVFQPPLNIVYVIDVSGSTDERFLGAAVGDMNGDGDANTVLDAEIANLIALTERVRGLGYSPEDVTVTVVPFSSDAGTAPEAAAAAVGPTTFGLGRPGDAGIKTYLKSLDSGGGTNFEAALGAAADALGVLDPFGFERNAIYFLSDGEGTGSFGDELAILRNSFHAQISAIGIGEKAELGMLNTIDRLGKATRITTGDASDLDVSLVTPYPSGVVTKVEIKLGGREIAKFTPLASEADDGLLTFRVEMDRLARFVDDTNVITADVTFAGQATPVTTSVTIKGALPRSTDFDM